MSSITSTILPMFPLSVFLLPGGITRLRIFEARYLRMVGLASDGFVIVPKIENKQDLHWGSWVEIINFDQGNDGVLEIDVRCKSLVKITVVNVADDQLTFVDTEDMTHWSQKQASTDLGKLTGSLLSLIDNNALLQDLYVDKAMANPYWVIARWLELLPIPLDIKHQFISPRSYQEAKKLVNSII